MQSNIFAKVAPLLKEMKFDTDFKSLETFLSRYHTAQWIYPSAMQRELHLAIQDVYTVLEAGVMANVLEQNLEIYCPHCQRFVGVRYKTLYDIPEEISCVHCDTEVEHPLQHAIVIYKVL